MTFSTFRNLWETSSRGQFIHTDNTGHGEKVRTGQLKQVVLVIEVFAFIFQRRRFTITDILILIVFIFLHGNFHHIKPLLILGHLSVFNSVSTMSNNMSFRKNTTIL